MSRDDTLTYQPDYSIAIPPGVSLKETLSVIGMSQKEMAARLDMTEQSLVRILKGSQPISYDTAERLEMVTGTPASFWNNLEAIYREQLAKIEQRKRLEADIEWLDIIPLADLRKREAISRTRDKVAQLKETLHFFGVSSVAAWNSIWEQPAVAARRSPCFESRPGSAAVWIRLGELQANEIECLPFDKVRFKEAVNRIRMLTRENPNICLEEMRRECSESGVALALVPEMPKVPWSGASKWLAPTKAMILLNLRGKWEDLFWFSFFHEAGHVLNDSKKDLYINDGSKKDPREIRADEFAAELLIPARYNEMIQVATVDEDIISIARELEIAPGIVVGRYQFLTENWSFFNHLKQKFEWGAVV